jgi:hypothetical protein
MTVQLIGGEMSVWSDLDGTHGPAPAGDPSLLPLLKSITGRTLVAGPHAPTLIDAIPAPEITLLVRGVTDAELLAARFASRPGVTICCGSLEKLATIPAYDTVVALDGLDRLLTTEAAELTWDETLTRLLAARSPRGRLLLRLENLFGIHRLVALPTAPTDTEWVTADDRDPSRPLGPDAMRARLAAAGVPVARDYAAYPGALLGGGVLSDPALGGFLEATLARSVPEQSAPAQPQLTDPARLVAGAVRHRLADDLAPSWIFLAGPGSTGPEASIAAAGPGSLGARASIGSAGPGSLGARASIGSAGPGSLGAGASTAASRSAGAEGPIAASASAASAASAGTAAGGGVAGVDEIHRDGGGRWVRGDGVPVPLGRTLEGLLLAACQRRALPDVRELLGAWQAGPVAGVPATQVVVDAEGNFHGVASAGKPLEALRHLAASMIGGGYAHLWPSPADEVQLTALLAGMTGREVDPSDVPAITQSTVESVRELTIARDRLTEELADARAKHEFYERQIANRDHELKRLRQMNAILSATTAGKAANTLVDGLKAGRRAVRAVVRRTRD